MQPGTSSPSTATPTPTPTPTATATATREPAGALPHLVDATAGRVAGAGLGLGSLVRRRRIFHPHGVAFRATLDVAPERSLGSELLDDAGERACVVRLSRGIGLPAQAPDILGIAVRALGRADGGTGDQDLLFATVLGEAGAARHVLAPARSFGDRPLTTILPYRTERDLVVLTLRAQGSDARTLRTLETAAAAFQSGRLTFELRAHAEGETTTVGHLRGGERIPDDEAEALRFNPFHAAGDLRPAGVLNALRRRAYRLSQRARPTG